MIFVVVIVALGIICAIDGAYSSVCASIVVFLLTSLYSLRIGKYRMDAFQLNCVVFLVYYVSAYVVSTSFDTNSYFMVSDSSRYIERYIYKTSFDNDINWFVDYYIRLGDSNALYNTYLTAIAIFFNGMFGETSVFAMTLSSTVFGIMSISVFYEILLMYVSKEKAYHYTLLYAFLSIFFIYSCVILRDIIIVYFFLLAIKIILKPFRVYNLLSLVVFMLLVWGVRLYSGLFYGTFIMLYLYIRFHDTKYRKLALLIFGVFAIFVFAAVLGSAATTQAMAEIEHYNEFTSDKTTASGGLISNLYKLPVGIQQVAIMFYSQMAPFPPYGLLTEATTFSQFWMSLSVIIYELFWFFVFYTLLSSIVFQKTYLRFTYKEILLLFIAVAFILANTAHPDLRRMMPVYPIIYLLYVKVKECCVSGVWVKRVRQNLAIAYIGLLIVYFVVKI